MIHYGCAPWRNVSLSAHNWQQQKVFMRREDEVFKKLKKEKPLIHGSHVQQDAPRVARRRIASLSVDAPQQPARRGQSAPAMDEPVLGGRPAARTIRTREAIPAREPAKPAPATDEPVLGGESTSAAPVQTRTISVQRAHTRGDATGRTARSAHAGYAPAVQRAATPPAAYRRRMIPANVPDAPPPTYRHELKYYINTRDYALVRAGLKVLLQPDENAGPTGEYHVRSLYFDDIYETALAEKIAGVARRDKYRVRIYNCSSSVIRLEKKSKRGKFISKQSLPLTLDEYHMLISGQPTFLLEKPQPLAREMYLQMRQRLLSPRVVVDYIREPYVLRFETVRITFDKYVKSGAPGDLFDPDLPTVPQLDQGVMVLEVKFNKSLPGYIQAVLNNLTGPQQSAISKYTLCRKYD